MPRVTYSVEQIIHKLREAEVLLGQGQTVKDICRKWNITDPTYYRWRQEYGGLKLDQAKRLKDLERENSRLKPQSSQPLNGSETNRRSFPISASPLNESFRCSKPAYIILWRASPTANRLIP